MTRESREQFREVVRADPVDLGLACALIGVEVDPDLAADAVTASLDDLAADALGVLPPDATADQAAAALRAALADQAGFRGDPSAYGDLRGSLLHEVLRRRIGLPILLSVVYIEIGRRLGIAVGGVGVPGHFVAAVTVGSDRVLLDPYNAGRVTDYPDLVARVAELHPHAALSQADLVDWHPVDIVARVLGNIRGMSVTPEALRTQLWATELSLLLPRRPAALRRDHARLLARLGDFATAATELEEYADLVAGADPDAAAAAKRQALLVRSRLS